MPNRRLTAEEMRKAHKLLDEIRAKLERLSAGDRELLFAYRRKIYKHLTYDERSSPMARRKVKAQKRAEQEGLCAICRKPLPEKYAVLDRFNAVDGYTVENTRLIHPECDIEVQEERGYA
jgi:hypothetical protein